MKLCKKCNSSFEVQKGLINYCSLSCKNGRQHTLASKEKISKKVLANWKSGVMDKIDYYALNNSPQKKERSKATWDRKTNAKHLNGEKLHVQTVRKIMLKKAEYKCGVCNLSDWLDLPITLELHHIDGVKTNHEISNFIVLCPNCHSQTDNFRAKNKKNKTNEI
jgi:5-methylcytosine-specific restriction endonuclease McrA